MKAIICFFLGHKWEWLKGKSVFREELVCTRCYKNATRW